ncbi:hypothetical protein KJA15_03035 [Patescibacteria group bacterium]|nr:hypothetical protein [Patescibacteria group bacterium]
MQKTFLLVIFILGLLAGVFVFAQISFPVKELGNCQNEEECKAYCDNWENIEECVSFAEAHNLLSPEELAEAKKMMKALAEGAVPPGGCSNPTQCEAYCEEPTKIEECIDFAEKAGLIPPFEAAEARLVRKAMLAGIPFPGDCRTKKKCDAYCSQPDHMGECFSYACKIGILSSAECSRGKKTVSLMAKGESPGGCQTKEECEAYCAQKIHFQECADFASKAGLMTPEEKEMFLKTGGQGPGGCQSKEECEAFCNNPANQEVCFNFAKEHDLIPEEEIQKTKEGIQQLQEGLKQAPPEVLECIKSTVGEEVLEKIQTGTFMPSPEVGEKIKNCFEKYMPKPSEGEMGLPPEGMPPEGKPPEMVIPPELEGKCTSPEECKQYCTQNPQEPACKQLLEEKPPEGEYKPPEGKPPEMVIPPELEGKCTSPEECKQYCTQNPQEPACKQLLEEKPPEGE